MNKTILILTNSDSGLYEFRKEVVETLVAQGYEVHISAPDTGSADRLKKLGAEVHVTGLDRRGMNPLKDLKLYNGYKKLIKSVSPGTVLTYTIKPNVYGGVACRRMHVPFLPNVTGLGTTLQGDGMLKKFIVLMYKTGLKDAACVFFQNEYNRTFMKKAGCISSSAHTRLLCGSGVNLEEHRLRRYPDGNFPDVDDRESEEFKPDGKIHILNIGRIMDDKGSMELLKCAGVVHAAHPDVVFDILGSYEEETRNKYEPMVDNLVKKGAVRYHGFRQDVNNFYGICHALIHPSYHEGMSNVVQEAAASGRPVLTADIPGCSEIYENGVGGMAFRRADAESMINTVEKFLRLSNIEKENMGLQARKYVEAHFDRKLVTQAYLEEIKKTQ